MDDANPFPAVPDDLAIETMDTSLTFLALARGLEAGETSRDAITAALLATAMNCRGNSHGLDSIAPWLADAAERMLVAASPQQSDARH